MRLDIPQNAILLPYIDPIMGQMWMPSGTRAMWDFRNGRGGAVQDWSGRGNTLTLSGATDTNLNRYFDGSDDYGSAANSPALDITAAPLAIFATIKTPAVLQTGYIVCKNLDSVGTTQYAYHIDSTGFIQCFLNGNAVAKTNAGVVAANSVYNIGYEWIKGLVQVKLNGRVLELATGGTYSGVLTSRPYFRIGRRETAAAYFKGNIDNICLYASADTQAIMRHQGYFMRRLGIKIEG